MDYVLLTYIAMAIGLSVFISSIVIKKRIPIIFLLYLLFYVTLTLIKLLDIDYYNDLFKGIKNEDIYILLASLFFVLICLIETILKKNKSKEIIKETTSFNINEIFSCFNQLKSDFAIYNEHDKTYVLNEHMRLSFKKNENVISLDDFNKLKFEEDKSSNKYYRLCINNEYPWFEETIVNISGNTFKVVYQTNSLQETSEIGNYKDLDEEILNLRNEKQEFGLLIINIMNIYENLKVKYSYMKNKQEVVDKDVKSTYIDKYILDIISGDYKNYIKAYHLGENEFAFVLTSKQIYDLIERSLYSDNSVFTKYNMNIDNTTISILSKCALVYSKNVKDNTEYAVINAAFDLLQMVVSKNYEENYAVYKEIDTNEPNYSLKDLGIDLENDLENVLKNDQK